MNKKIKKNTLTYFELHGLRFLKYRLLEFNAQIECVRVPGKMRFAELTPSHHANFQKYTYTCNTYVSPNSSNI